MVATRRGSVDDPSAGKSPSDTNDGSTGGQEEPQKLRGSGPSAGDTESGKRSASPAELPEVTSAKRQKTDDPEPVEKSAENTETVERKDTGANLTAATLVLEDAKPPSPLLEVKDEVLEEAPGAQEKLEEGGTGEPPPAVPQPDSRNPAAAAKLGNFDDLHLRVQLMRARQEAEAQGKPLIGTSAGPLRDQKWGDLISQYPEHPHAVLSGICFTIGRSKSCSLRLPDSDVSGMLARLYLRGNAVYFENLGGTGTVSLNGRDCKRGDKTVLKSGDELAFSGSKQFAYVSSADGGACSVLEMRNAVY